MVVNGPFTPAVIVGEVVGNQRNVRDALSRLRIFEYTAQTLRFTRCLGLVVIYGGRIRGWKD